MCVETAPGTIQSRMLRGREQVCGVDTVCVMVQRGPQIWGVLGAVGAIRKFCSAHWSHCELVFLDCQLWQQMELALLHFQRSPSPSQKRLQFCQLTGQPDPIINSP